MQKYTTIEELKDLLDECRLQIEYLHNKFKETGTGNNVLSRIKIVLDTPVSAPSVPDAEKLWDWHSRLICEIDDMETIVDRNWMDKEGFMEAISQIQTPSVQPQSEGGLQWVKASERLPSISGRYFIKAEYIADPSRGIFSHVARFTDGVWDDGYTGVTHTVIEWLDENSPSTANTAVSALQSILRNIDNGHWNCGEFREEIKSIAEQGLKTANTEESKRNSR